MNIRPRTDWQDPKMPVVGPAMRLREVAMVPAHYTAASTIPSDTAAYLRSIQRDYTVNRGYSIGYNFAIDQAGVGWECRGFDIKCAANKGVNDVTIAILCLVDGAEAMNPAMVDTFNALAAEAQRLTSQELVVVGHRDIGATACPGDGIYRQVATGQLDATIELPPIPIPPPQPEEDDDMAFIITNIETGENALVYGDGKVTGIAPMDVGPFVAKFGAGLPVQPEVFADYANKGKD